MGITAKGKMNFSDINYVIKGCKNREVMRICAIDIGHRNFALCIEEFELPIIKGEDIINQGQIIKFEKRDFGERKKTEIEDRRILIACSDFLDEIIDDLNECDVIIIEKQIGFTGPKKMGKSNPFAQKIEHHVYSYFTFMFREFKYYGTFMAKHKTQVLGAPPKQTKPERKKWCIEKGCEILANRGDSETLLIIKNNKSKADDLCDTFCMIQAWKILNYKKLI